MNNGPKSPSILPSPAHCPYLNLRDDPQTSLAFPSIWNYCYRAVPPASVRIEHQIQVCQTARFSECVVYQRKESRALPAELQSIHVRQASSSKRKLRLILLGLLALAILSLWGVQAGVLHLAPPFDLRGLKNPSKPAGSASPVASALSSNLALAPSAKLEDTATPKLDAPTGASAGLCGVPLDTPIGTDQKFIIHRVGRGESLNGYEVTYGTSSEAILAANYGLRVPVLSNSVIVIPLDQTDPSVLPAFEVYQADAADGSIELLSSKLDVDPQQLARYNDFPQSCRTISGWLLVPRQVFTP